MISGCPSAAVAGALKTAIMRQGRLARQANLVTTSVAPCANDRPGSFACMGMSASVVRFRERYRTRRN